MCFPKLPDYPASCFPQSPTWGLRDFQAFEQQVPWALRAQRMAGTPARTCLAGLLIHLITHLVQSRTGTHLATPAHVPTEWALHFCSLHTHTQEQHWICTPTLSPLVLLAGGPRNYIL
jgi:hypothetical protein